MPPILRQVRRVWSSGGFRIARGVSTLLNVMLIFQKVRTGTGRDLIPVNLLLTRVCGILIQTFIPDPWQKNRSMERGDAGPVLPNTCTAVNEGCQYRHLFSVR